MSYELSALLMTATSIGFIHTILGPDHYLPFIAMSKSGDWSLQKTTWITFLCGIGHVLSSIVLGFIGVALGVAMSKIEAFESFRGNIAAWALIGFGFAYFIWGIRRAHLHKPHSHLHPKQYKNMTPWVLFIIFAFGPCEALIPLLMYPAAKEGLWNLLLVTSAFGASTILTMMSIVLISSFGVKFIPLSKLEKYTHAIAGATVFLCGISIEFLGL